MSSLALLLVLVSCQAPAPVGSASASAGSGSSSQAAAVSQTLPAETEAPENPGESQNPPPASGQGQAQGQAAATEETKRRTIAERTFQLSDLKMVDVKIDKHKFRMWVMDTNDKRMEGMMFVENGDFKDNEGMIFVFPEPEFQRFWMRNTLVPLDIAYVGSNLRILNTYTMKPLDETTDYSSYGKSGIVIEVRGGLFKRLGIGRGMAVTLPEGLKAKD